MTDGQCFKAATRAISPAKLTSFLRRSTRLRPVPDAKYSAKEIIAEHVNPVCWRPRCNKVLFRSKPDGRNPMRPSSFKGL